MVGCKFLCFNVCYYASNSNAMEYSRKSFFQSESVPLKSALVCPISRYYLGTLKVLLWFFVQLPLSNKIGECHGSFKSPPRIREYTYFYPLLPKKVKKISANSFSLDLKFFYCPLLYPKVS